MTTHDAQQLADHTVLVIGGTSGIGEAVARQAAAVDATVTVTGRDNERLASSASHPWISATVELDAHDDDELEHFFADTETVDHVVSLVGDSMAGGFLDTPPKVMRHVWQSKFWANWRIGQQAARCLPARRQSHIHGGHRWPAARDQCHLRVEPRHPRAR